MSPNEGDKRPAIIILGALSAIAEAAARIWAEQGARLFIAGRDAGKLEAIAANLRLRGASMADTYVLDLASGEPGSAFQEMTDRLGGVDIVLLAYGTLGDQKLAETSLEEAQRILTANFTSAAGWCLAAANVLEKQGHGTLIVIGSVAGDRGRASNYLYGAAKGGLAVLVQGIAHRLAKSGASAVVVKPGFVDTPMTAHIARKGCYGRSRRQSAKRSCVLRTQIARPMNYTPGFWRWIMTAIRVTPSTIFHKTKL